MSYMPSRESNFRLAAHASDSKAGAAGSAAPPSLYHHCTAGGDGQQAGSWENSLTCS